MNNLTRFILAAVLMSGSATAQFDPEAYRPTGTLDVDKTWVNTGSKVQLDWNIYYPITIPGLLIVDNSGEVRTMQDVVMKVRVLGVAFENETAELSTVLYTSIDDQPWESIFHGVGSDVNAPDVLFERFVPANTTINFAAQGQMDTDNTWHDFRATGTADPTVVGIANGQEPPYYAPAYQQGDIKSFLTAYMGKSNNGHGNNLDGVDVSNPGAGDGGPNGEVDASGTYDDEAKTVAQIGPRDMIYLWELASRDTGEWWYDQQDMVILVTYEEPSQ